MEIKHSLSFDFLELRNKEKKDGYNSCYLLCLAGIMLTDGWH